MQTFQVQCKDGEEKEKVLLCLFAKGYKWNSGTLDIRPKDCINTFDTSLVIRGTTDKRLVQGDALSSVDRTLTAEEILNTF